MGSNTKTIWVGVIAFIIGVAIGYLLGEWTITGTPTFSTYTSAGQQANKNGVKFIVPQGKEASVWAEIFAGGSGNKAVQIFKTDETTGAQVGEAIPITDGDEAGGNGLHCSATSNKNARWKLDPGNYIAYPLLDPNPLAVCDGISLPTGTYPMVPAPTMYGAQGPITSPTGVVQTGKADLWMFHTPAGHQTHITVILMEH
jgi:hypothetical protein